MVEMRAGAQQQATLPRQGLECNQGVEQEREWGRLGEGSEEEGMPANQETSRLMISRRLGDNHRHPARTRRKIKIQVKMIARTPRDLTGSNIRITHSSSNTGRIYWEP